MRLPGFGSRPALRCLAGATVPGQTARWPCPLVPAHLRATATAGHMFRKPPQVLAHRAAGKATALGPHERHSWKMSPPSLSPHPAGDCALQIPWPPGRRRGVWVLRLSLLRGVRVSLAAAFCPPPRGTKMLREVSAADRGPQVPAPFSAMPPPHSRPVTGKEGGGRGPWGPGRNTFVPGDFRLPSATPMGRRQQHHTLRIPILAPSAPYSGSVPRNSLRPWKCPLSALSTAAAPAAVAVSSRHVATPTEQRNSASFHFN